MGLNRVRRLIRNVNFTLCFGRTDARLGTVRPLKSYDLIFKHKLSGARLMCVNAGQAPSGHRCLFTIILQCRECLSACST